jgi:uncharacterized protein (TIGR03067 family)
MIMLRATILLAVVSVPGADPPKEQAKADSIEGTWTLASHMSHGVKTNLVGSGTTFIFKEGKLSIRVLGEVGRIGTYKVDNSKSPAHIDVTCSDGPSKGETHLGIFDVNGNRLRLSFDDSDATNRPAAIDGVKGSFFELTRDKK